MNQENTMSDSDIPRRVLSEFRRHYHRARSIHGVLPDQGQVKFRFKGDAVSGRCKAETIIPDEELVIRFALVMRRFLTPSSELYLPSVWKLLVGQYGEHISSEDRDAFMEGFRQLEASPIKLSINNREWSAKDVYELLSNGHIFGDDEEAAKLLRSQSTIPTADPLFRFQFVAYNTNGLQVASWIFEKLRQLKCNGVIDLTGAVRNPRCIYCLKTDGAFASQEHIVPEAFGWHDAILVPGIVCDRCNNGLLSVLDQSLVGFEPIRLLRVLYTQITKAGKYPSAEFQNMSIVRRGPRLVEYTAKDRTGEFQDMKELADGKVSWSLKFNSRPLDYISLGRSLFKIALGFIAYKQGHERALESRYDAARNFICGKSLFNNRLLISSTATPHPGFQAQYVDFPVGTGFLLNLFGVVFFFNLEEQPMMSVDEKIKDLGFLDFDLSRRPSTHL